MMDLHLLWFILLGFLLAGYAVLDGFDLGVGILHPLAKTDHERRVFMNSIGPLWDGNEVWLVTFGGALFAAFPEVYASVFSGFYIPFMALLFALIFRGVSMEFRSKSRRVAWRRFWDFAFFGGSLLATLLFGVAVGNTLVGIPIDANTRYAGTFFDLLNPYALVVGVLAIATFSMHGAIYLHLKTEGDLQKRVHRWVWHSFGFFLVMYILTTIFTLATIPNSIATIKQHSWAWIVVVLNVLAIGNIPRAIYLDRPFYAFISSCMTIVAFVFLFGVALFPNLITSRPDPMNSLTIYNAASSHHTLAIMAVIAAIGMPFVLAYTSIIYWVFRGKVTYGEHGY